MEGYNGQKATFSRTINVKQIGHAVLTVPAPGDAAAKPDTYLITLPHLHIEGLIMGAPYVELEGASYITSSTGFTAKIDYSGKGWLSGKKNSVTASLYPTGREKEVLYSVSGQWSKAFDIHRGPAKGAKPANLVDHYDAAASPCTALTVAPIDEQGPFESRRAWSKVAAAIAAGDFDLVHVEKTKIEMAQREARAKEKAEGRMWQRRYFSVPTAPDTVLGTLGPHVGVPEHGDSDKTGGLWRYDPGKADKARKTPALSAEEKLKVQAELLGQK